MKRPDASYTYRIEKWDTIGELSEFTRRRVCLLVNKIEDQLDLIRNRSTKECLHGIGEVLFRYNNNSDEIFDIVLASIAQNTGG